MDQADIKLVGAIEAHLEAKDARIAELEKALRNLKSVAHREVSPKYSAELDEAFTLADIVLGEIPD